MLKQRLLLVLFYILLIAGFATLPLPYCSYAWIPGVLFILSAAIGFVLFVNSLRFRVDALDKKLSATWKEQLSLLFGMVGLAFLLCSGIMLVWHPDFNDVKYESSIGALVHVAHRFAGYNYYDDTLGLNTFLLLVSFIGAILLGGILITTFTNIVQEKKEKYLTGVTTYKMNGHFVILGFGDVVYTLCHELLSANSHMAVILTNQDIPLVRSKLKSKLQNDVFERVILYSGNIDEQESLARLSIDRCKEVYVLGEQDATGHDSTNLGILKQLNSFLPDDYSDMLKVYLQMDSQSSFSVIQKLDVPDDYVCKGNKTIIDLHIFNVYENQARLLWGYYKDNESWDIDFSDINGPKLLPNSNCRVNLVIAGFDRMGQALLLEALRICHFPNYSEESNNIKTIITLIDKNMDELWAKFISRYPNISHIEDIEIHHYSESLESPHIRELLSKYAKDNNELLTVAICFWNPDDSFAAGLSLPDSLYFNIDNGVASNNEHVRILIRNESNNGIKDIVTDGATRYRNVRFFGSIEDGLSKKLLDDKAALLQNAHYDTLYPPQEESSKRIIYEELNNILKTKNVSILSAYKQEELDSEQVLTWSRRFWNETSENHKFSNRYQIEMYGIYEHYLQCLQKCYAAQCDAIISQMEHRRWCAERYIMGYQYADMQSGSNLKKQKDNWKVHNDLVPFSKLNDKEKAKDLVHLTMPAINDILKSHS